MRLARVIIAAILAILIPAGGVSADLRTPWWSYSEDTYLYTNEDCLTVNDCIRTRATNMLWGSAAYNMHHMATHGARFTVNMADLDEHVSATDRIWTNLPAPYFDRDLYGAKCTEAEITSESASFPTYGSYYFANFWFTHWFWIGSGWSWENAAGTIDYSEQISKQYWWTSDKWDTASPDWNPGSIAFMEPRFHDYPAKSRPSTNPSSSDDPCQYDGGPLSVPAGTNAVAIDDLEGLGRNRIARESQRGPILSIAAGDQRGEVWVELPGKADLGTWARQANALARRMAASGATHATITFARPVAASDLADLASTGVAIHRIEAVSQPLANGTRATFIDRYYPDAFEVMNALAAEEGVGMLGVVAAEVTVPDRNAMNDVLSRPDVFSVDASGEYVLRTQPSVVDTNVSDVYWELAGWIEN